MKDISNPAPSAAWYADWLKHRNSEVPLRSIVIGAKCSANLQRIGAQVANYLNEFDSEAEGHWRAFSADDLRHCAGDPTCRDLVLSGAPCELHPHSPDTDIERLARCLARVGGAVVEGEFALDEANGIDKAFRVCLCSEDPLCFGPCHMWLNPGQFSRESLVSVIADSFLDWTSRQADEDRQQAMGAAPHPTGGAEPSGPFIASL
jgi:hypothetical protein